MSRIIKLEIICWVPLCIFDRCHHSSAAAGTCASNGEVNECSFGTPYPACTVYARNPRIGQRSLLYADINGTRILLWNHDYNVTPKLKNTTRRVTITTSKINVKCSCNDNIKTSMIYMVNMGSRCDPGAIMCHNVFVVRECYNIWSHFDIN